MQRSEAINTLHVPFSKEKAMNPYSYQVHCAKSYGFIYSSIKN